MRLDGSMSIKKRSKIVDRFNDPVVSAMPTLTSYLWVCLRAATLYSC